MSTNECRSIVILGASGNLALTKLLPSLYTLFTSGAMPQNYTITGYARTDMSNEDFRTLVESNLKDAVEETQLEPNYVREFLSSIHYCSGGYDSKEDFAKMHKYLDEIAADFPSKPTTLYYLSIPPSVFEPVIHSLRECGAVEKGDSTKSVIVEKPFGYDTESAKALNKTLYETFDESQIYRIDHYLGKEAIMNLMVMRFANIIFEPVWNRNYIESVTVSWEENKHIGSRGGYFDKAGIIRDVIQNHLLQILALVAMEEPSDYDSESIMTEKIKAVKSIGKISLDDCVLGQYTSGVCDGKAVIGYTDEDSVPDGSKRETFALLKCEINNSRWSGVPFYLRAGKALPKSSTEIIIQFKDVPGSIFTSPHHANKLVIKVQPDAGIKFFITNKVPGKGMVLKDVKLDFSYHDGFNIAMPGAYERLILDAIQGDKTLFICYEELIDSWEIFTPILEKIDAGEANVYPYAAGTSGPDQVNELFN
ncbi:MAG: glucose-6-phosphate dehydrogenase [Lentisphaeraceae bacterium]|nr:glucose-6-phosphate dehydrogenase [Lentisphaeraceae bacterium]